MTYIIERMQSMQSIRKQEDHVMYHVVVNPASRSGKGLRLWKEIVEPGLKKEGVDYRAYFSEKAGDVERLVREITAAPSDNRDTADKLSLILLGGDGTVNEALQGLTEPSRVVIGYIPTGSSNDLARDLGIPKNPARALEHILHSDTIHTMDMGVVEAEDGMVHRFADSCGIGFDAAVCENVLHSKAKGILNKLGLGKLTYLAVALKQLYAAKAASCELLLDDQVAVHTKRILFNACMIHRYEGGGFQFCPDANDHDGILNLCTVGDIPKLKILFALPTAFFGKHYWFKGVEAHSASYVRITTSIPLCLHTDGEVLGHYKDLTITCIKDALNIII